MANFTDAVYDVTKLGNPTPLIYSLSGINNVIVLSGAGTFNGANVGGVLYNSSEFTSPLSATQTVTISSPGDTATTVIRLLSGSPTGVAICLINKNNFSTTLTLLSSSSTLIARVSAGNYDNIGPDNRRRWNLNG